MKSLFFLSFIFIMPLNGMEDWDNWHERFWNSTCREIMPSKESNFYNSDAYPEPFCAMQPWLQELTHADAPTKSMPPPAQETITGTLAIKNKFSNNNYPLYSACLLKIEEKNVPLFQKKLKGKFQCGKCNKKYPTKFSYDLHQYFCMRTRPFVCPQKSCPLSTHKRRYFEKHLRTHAGCTCLICKRKFATFHGYVIHTHDH